MMCALIMAAVGSMFMAGAACAEPLKDDTVGVPVAFINDAEAWHHELLGSDVEVLRPAPGDVEFKVAPGVWFQVFETGGQQASGAIVRSRLMTPSQLGEKEPKLVSVWGGNRNTRDRDLFRIF